MEMTHVWKERRMEVLTAEEWWWSPVAVEPEDEEREWPSWNGKKPRKRGSSGLEVHKHPHHGLKQNEGGFIHFHDIYWRRSHPEKDPLKEDSICVHVLDRE